MYAAMSFARKDYEFLKEIGIGPKNLGAYVNGVWQGNGPMVSSVNPSDNQVSERLSFFFLFFLVAGCVDELVVVLMINHLSACENYLSVIKKFGH